MGLDFFGVFLEGKIRTFDSTSGEAQVFDLWIDQPEPSASLPAELKALSYVSQINTEMRLGMNTKISIVMTPPFEEALAFLDSRLIQWGVGQLSVTFGYKTGSGAGNVAGPFNGLIQKPAVQVGADITITLNALGVGYALNLIGGSDPRVFTNKSYADVVKILLAEVVKGHGVKLDGIYDDFDDESDGTGKSDVFFQRPAPETSKGSAYSGPAGASKRDAEIAALRKKSDAEIASIKVLLAKETKKSKRNQTKIDEFNKRIDEELLAEVLREDKVRIKYAADQEPGPINIGPRNSWWYIHETLRQHGKELLIKGDEVKVVASENWLKKIGPTAGGFRKHFQLRGETDPNRNIFPILQFTSPTTAVYLNPGMGKIAMQDIPNDKSRKNSVKQVHDDSNSPATTTGGGAPDTETIGPTATKPLDATKNHPGNPHDPVQVQRAKAEWKRLRMEGGIRAKVTTLGIPTLLPGEVVQISGFLPRGEIGEMDPKTKKPARGLFDGAYGVIKVNHSVGNGGYITTFESVSNFYPHQWANARKTKSPQTDIQKPEEGNDKARIKVTAIDESKLPTVND